MHHKPKALRSMHSFIRALVARALQCPTYSYMFIPCTWSCGSVWSARSSALSGQPDKAATCSLLQFGMLLLPVSRRVVQCRRVILCGCSTAPASALSTFGRRSSRHLDEVRQCTEAIHEKALAPLNARLLGPLERRQFTEGVPMPFVLLLGNHSSGKSSFINYLLGRKVQTTGVAPTDDGFTVIAPGEQDVDRDGASFVGDPSLGFSALRAFGPSFLSHLVLKVRCELEISQLMLIDSPGMIDSPSLQRSSPLSEAMPMHASENRQLAERGYDFLGVTKWLAEHADVILLFFDPDKPGTTGETLECLTTSLPTSEHKLHIIMNKVDQFVHIHDFARAYGSLCWNLSKVIPRKDLPRIYTMFLPLTALNDRAQASARVGASPLSVALKELEQTREEVLRAVHSAPERRIDNLITQAHDEAALLRMHALVADEARTEYVTLRNRYAATIASLLLAGPAAATYVWLEIGGTAQVCAGIGAVSVMAVGVLGLWGQHALRMLSKELLTDVGLDMLFKRCHQIEVADGDEFVGSLWRRVRPQLQHSLFTLSLAHIPKLSHAELEALNHVLQSEVPDLRRLVSPRSTPTIGHNRHNDIVRGEENEYHPGKRG